jgi:hypothetical protein
VALASLSFESRTRNRVPAPRGHESAAGGIILAFQSAVNVDSIQVGPAGLCRSPVARPVTVALGGIRVDWNLLTRK